MIWILVTVVSVLISAVILGIGLAAFARDHFNDEGMF